MDAARKLKNERGISLVYVAFALTALIGMAALAIDLGYFYVVKGQLQNASDAAALAGASGLKGIGGISPYRNESTARIRAQFFAQQNKAGNSPVLLSTDPTKDDIVIGCWNKAKDSMDTGCIRPNSVQVKARRSNDAGVGPTPVGTYFGKIFGFDTVDIHSMAVAQRPTKPTIPLSHCLPICPKDSPADPWTPISLPATFHFKTPGGNDTYTIEQVMGWTEFSATSKATDLGSNSDVAKFIRQELEIPIDVCNKVVYTNTGIGNLRPVLQAEYDENKDANGIWRVILPIYTECPAVNQAIEKHNTLVRYAEAEISGMVMSGKASDPTITIKSVKCLPCTTADFLSDTAQLVK